ESVSGTDWPAFAVRSPPPRNQIDTAGLEREIVRRRLLAINGHVAVIDLEDHRGHRRAINASTPVRAMVIAHEPASILVASIVLSADEPITHLVVPLLPHFMAL